MHDQRGQSLIELIIAIAIFGVVSTGVAWALLSSAGFSKQAAEYVAAAGYIQEALEGVRSVRDRDWSEITNGTHGLGTGSGYYELSGSSNSINGFTRTITIEDVYRTGSLTGDIAGSGVLDSSSKRVTVNLLWDTLQGKTQNIDAVFYLFNLDDIFSWVQTLTADFGDGNENSTDVTATSNGEVELRAWVTDWGNLDVQHELDLSGTADRIAMTYGRAQDVLYVLSLNNAGNEFVALDVSDVSEAAPTVIDTYSLGGGDGTDLVISEGYAYLSTTSASNEVHVVRLSDMTQVNTINMVGSEDATGIDKTGTTLVVTRESASLEEVYFYDVSDPEGVITEIGSTELGADLTDVVVSTDYAFITSSDNSEELFVVALDDYSEVNSLDLSGNGDANTAELVGDNLYIGRDNGSNDDLILLDVSTPEGTISKTSGVELSASVHDLKVDADETFVSLATDANSTENIIVELAGFIQISSGDATGATDAYATEIFGGHTYIGSDADGEDLSVFETNSGGWGTPSLVGSANKSGNHDATAIAVDGNFTYLGTVNAGSDDELFVYDTSTPSSPTLLGSFNVGGGVNEIVVDGDTLYLATTTNSREVEVIDVTTKSSPSRIGSYNAPGNTNMLSLALEGGMLYAGRDASSQDELYVLDVSTPSSPSLVTSVEYGDDLNDLVVDTNELYAATTNNSEELAVFDISTPASTTQLTSYDLTGNDNASSVALSGDMLVLGRDVSANSEIVLFDISTPSSPTVLGEGDVGAKVTDITLDGTDYAYVATEENLKQFQRWDLSPSSSPVLDVSYDLGSSANGVAWSGTDVFLATEANSLELQIIGAGSVSSVYATEGTFTSQAFDTGDAAADWSTIEWTSSGTGSIIFRLRTASSEAGLETATWVGSDGTEATNYSSSGETVTTDPGATGTQWVQWKAYLSGDGSTTPVLEDVTLRYAL